MNTFQKYTISHNDINPYNLHVVLGDGDGYGHAADRRASLSHAGG